MNIIKCNKRKKTGILTALLLTSCVAATSLTTYTTVVEAETKKAGKILDIKFRYPNNLTNNEAVGLTSEEIVNYDFSNYKILGEDAKKYTHSFVGVDTVIQLIIYNDDPSINVEKIMADTEKLVEEYENVISKTRVGSFTSTLNNTGEFDYSNSPYKSVINQLVDKAMYYEKLSKGKFDVTIEPVVKLWNINNGNTEVPKQDNIDAAVSLVDYNNFVNDSEAQRYKLLEGAQVDFGAIGKGQLADIIKANLMSKGINSALINLGGNVITIGAKPGDKNWVIAIQDPTAPTGEYDTTVEVKNKTVVSSGNYERYFINEGVRYHHIMDTTTGYPTNSGLAQTTIISDRSIDCDALSTTTFILGAEKGLELINSLDGFECLFIDDNKNYYFSDNFEKTYNIDYMK